MTEQESLDFGINLTADPYLYSELYSFQKPLKIGKFKNPNLWHASPVTIKLLPEADEYWVASVK